MLLPVCVALHSRVRNRRVLGASETSMSSLSESPLHVHGLVAAETEGTRLRPLFSGRSLFRALSKPFPPIKRNSLIKEGNKINLFSIRRLGGDRW